MTRETELPRIETEGLVIANINVLARECYEIAAAHGFWEKERNKGEQIALMHSELSEMLEGVRKPAKDQHCPEFSSEEIEAADVLVRLLDYSYGHGLRLGEAFVAKMTYNKSRPHKHGKAF